MAKSFTPWRRGRRTARIELALGVVSALGGLLAMRSGVQVAALFLFILAVVLANAGLSGLRRARVREFGKAFEQQHTVLALRRLQAARFECRSNVRDPRCGDIDLVVQARGAVLPVEIKSFVRWHQFALFFPGERERKALRQVRLQMDVLGAARGFIWLPQGRAGLLQRLFGVRSGAIRVVFGGEARLVRALKRFSS